MTKRGLLSNMFGPRPNYFAFAVRAAPELQADFSEHVVTADHAHEFDLLFTLCYFVEDPQLVATTRNADPLGTVRRKVGAVIAGEIGSLPWRRLWDSFRSSADAVVQDNLRPLRAFAATYGLGIRSISLGLQLPEAETSTLREVERDITDTRLRTGLELVKQDEEEVIELHRIESETRRRVHAVRHAQQTDEMETLALMSEQRRQLLRDLGEANSTALKNIGRNINSAVEWRDALRAGKAALSEMMGDTGGRALPPGNGGDPVRALPTPTGQAPEGRLLSLVAEIVAATGEVTPTVTRARLCGAMLHLVAQVLAGDTTARRDEYAQAARAAITRLDPPPAEEELERLRRLADPDHLERALRGL
jgi:hypothetical protein